MMFAKLFETKKYGQILVKIDDDDGPEVRYYFEPKGLGVCSMALSFTDDDKGDAWGKAERVFDGINEASVVETVGVLMDKIPTPS